MKIVFATNNLNKLSEIKLLLQDRVEVLSLKDINCFQELPETNPTIASIGPIKNLEKLENLRSRFF